MQREPEITFNEVNGNIPTNEEQEVLDIGLKELAKMAVGKLEDLEKAIPLPLRAAWNGAVLFETTLMTQASEQDTEDFVFTHAAEHKFYLHFPSVDTKILFLGNTRKRTPRNPTGSDDWKVGLYLSKTYQLS